MCTVFIIRKENKTIFAMNRDESYERDATSIDYDGGKGLYYGVDLLKGGSWFVANSNGDFSVVTNIRDKARFNDNKKSRGELPFKELAGENFCLDEYNPCNLISFKQGKLFYQNSLQGKKEIKDSFFGISNGVHPNKWPKVCDGIENFKNINFDKANFELILDIRNLMLDTVQYDFCPKGTGFSAEEEKVLSSRYIETEDYGTVSTTIMIIGEESIHLNEKNYVNQTEFNRIL
jgi:uncharacterized protein with NRDE domain